MSRLTRISARAGWSAAALTLIGAFAVIGLILQLVAPAPQGPALSSYATTPRGVAAWAELLARDGHRVRQLRRSLAGAALPAGATLVVLGTPAPATAADLRRLRRFLGAGGWLVLGSGAAAGAARLPGHVVSVADPGFLENQALASDGNALRSLGLAGPPSRPVIFDEAVHGYGAATGLAALPERWWLALAGLALAAGWWALSHARRLGGADPVPPPAAAPRSAYVEAMAATLARVGDRPRLASRLDAAATGEEAFRRSLRT